MPRLREASTSKLDRLRAEGAAGLFAVLIFSIFYFSDVLLRASEKFFWYDELFTVYFARLPSLHALWAALGSGVDFNPPPFYLLTRASNAVFGEGNIATRLPEIFGFWIFSLCLYRFASRHAGRTAGVIAMLLPMGTGAYYYAYEARPHALVFGFCGLALVCWQAAMDRSAARLWPLIGFAAALEGALMMHCYAVVLAVPFACAEIARSLRKRRIEWRVWWAIAVPLALALLIYVPLLRSYRRLETGTTFATGAIAGWSQVGHFYSALFEPGIVIIVAALALLALDRRDNHATYDAQSITRDALIGVALLLLPIFGVALAKVMHGPFFNRYFDSAIAGVAILVAFGAGCRGARSRSTIGIAAVLVVFLLVNFGRLAVARAQGKGAALREPSSGYMLDTTPGEPMAMHPLLRDNHGTLPIAVVNPLEYLYLLHYAPDLRARLYFVASAADDFTYKAFPRFFRCCAQIANAPELSAQFAREHNEYLVYGDGGRPQQVETLATPGTCVQSLVFREGHFLAQMRMATAKGTLQ